MKERTIVLSGAGVLALVALASSARAQENREDVLVTRHKEYQTPQQFAFELRFAPFYPAVDSEPSLKDQTPSATPFRNTFGGSDRLLFEGEFDWQVVRIPHFGSIGPGIGIGYTKMSADAQFTMPHGASQTFQSGETTSLTIVPIYLVAVARADVLWREAHVPLVPYAKLGLNYSIWRASNTLGTSQYQSVAGDGGSLGTQFGLGIAFNVNVFDEYAAKTFDESVGVNGTYVFAEYSRSDLDGLGIQQHPLRVGGQTATFGVTAEF